MLLNNISHSKIIGCLASGFCRFLYALVCAHSCSWYQFSQGHCRKTLEEDARNDGSGAWFRIYWILIASYAGANVIFVFLLRIPFLQRQAAKCSNVYLFQFFKWLHQVWTYSLDSKPFYMRLSACYFYHVNHVLGLILPTYTIASDWY